MRYTKALKSENWYSITKNKTYVSSHTTELVSLHVRILNFANFFKVF